MTKKYITIAPFFHSISTSFRYLSFIFLAAILIACFGNTAFGKAGEDQYFQTANASESKVQMGSTFRGAELFGYLSNVGQYEIRLQVMYSVREMQIPESEQVFQINKNGGQGVTFSLQREDVRIHVNQMNLEKGDPNPENDMKLVTYVGSLDLSDSSKSLELLWVCNQKLGLINNIELADNNNISLCITIDNASIGPKQSSRYLGLFPFMNVSNETIDSSKWDIPSNLYLDYNSPSTTKSLDNSLNLAKIKYADGYSEITPLGNSVKVDKVSKIISLRSLNFGSYLLGFSVFDNPQQNNKSSHQAIYIIKSNY